MHLFSKHFGHTFDIGQPLALSSMPKKILQAQCQTTINRISIMDYTKVPAE
jgi:hypothetical protein